MKRVSRYKGIVAGLFLAIAPLNVLGASVSSEEAPLTIGAELKKMYEEDQEERRAGRLNAERDRARLEKVRGWLLEDRLTAPEDYYHAAMIFQHSVDRSGRDHLIAHVLASIAAFEGHERARWLSAAALDRSLEFGGQEQFFGTQMKRDENGAWGPGDHDVHRTDAVRRAFDVPER